MSNPVQHDESQTLESDTHKELTKRQKTIKVVRVIFIKGIGITALIPAFLLLIISLVAWKIGAGLLVFAMEIDYRLFSPRKEKSNGE